MRDILQKFHIPREMHGFIVLALPGHGRSYMLGPGLIITCEQFRLPEFGRWRGCGSQAEHCLAMHPIGIEE